MATPRGVGLLPTGLIVAVLSVSTPGSALGSNSYLDAANDAYRRFEYAQVIPLLEQALAIAVESSEQIAIYSLLAEMYVTYNRTEEARAAFREVLRRDPTFVLPSSASPKMAAVLEKARAEAEREQSVAAQERPPSVDESSPAPRPGAVAGPLAGIPPPLSQTGTERPTGGGAVLGAWWFWTVVGVVVVGAAGAVTWASLAARPPRADYGPYAMAGAP